MREKRHTLYIKQAKWDVSLYNLHLIVIHIARQLNYTVKQWKKPPRELEQLWQPRRLDLRSQLLDAPWVPMQKERLTELKINLSETQLQTFFSFFFHTTKSGLSSKLHVGIICDWLLQSRFSRTHQKDVWGGQVCFADLPGRWLMLCVLLICTTLPETAERGCGTHSPFCLDKTRAGGDTLFLHPLKSNGGVI